MAQSIESINQGKQKTGVPRSTKWPAVRRRILKGAQCAACGSRQKLRAHHVISVSEAPERELDETNIIVLCESNLDHNCHLTIGHNGEWQTTNPNAREDAARQRALHDSPAVEPKPAGVGGAIAASVLEQTPDGQKTQRLAERALLNSGFEVSPDIQRGLVTSMAQVALDAKYDARRRTQAALTLAKFQNMRTAELHDRERLRLQQESLGKGSQTMVQVNTVNQFDVRAAVADLRRDQAYVDYVRNRALERDADASDDGSFAESGEVEDFEPFDRD